MSRPAMRTVAVRGRLVADQGLDQGRLAAAGRADEEDELAAIDGQRDPVERHVAAGVDLGHVAQLDDRLASRPPSLRLLAARLSLSRSGHARGPFSGYRVTPAPHRPRNSAPNSSERQTSELLASPYKRQRSSAACPAGAGQHRIEIEAAGEGEAGLRQWEGGAGEAGGSRAARAEEAARVAAIGEAPPQVHPQAGDVPPVAGRLGQRGFEGRAIGAVALSSAGRAARSRSAPGRCRRCGRGSRACR